MAGNGRGSCRCSFRQLLAGGMFNEDRDIVPDRATVELAMDLAHQSGDGFHGVVWKSCGNTLCDVVDRPGLLFGVHWQSVRANVSGWCEAGLGGWPTGAYLGLFAPPNGS